MCVQILIKPRNNNFHEHSFSGSVVVSWVHQKWAEGAIFIDDLQGFKRAHKVMIFVGPNFRIKWPEENYFSFENQFIIGLFKILFLPLKLNEMQNNHNIANIYYIPELFIAFRQNNVKIVASLFVK
jgi:hypothetical protein